jgi:hypothetical protein
MKLLLDQEEDGLAQMVGHQQLCIHHNTSSSSNNNNISSNNNNSNNKVGCYYMRCLQPTETGSHLIQFLLL